MLKHFIVTSLAFVAKQCLHGPRQRAIKMFQVGKLPSRFQECLRWARVFAVGSRVVSGQLRQGLLAPKSLPCRNVTGIFTRKRVKKSFRGQVLVMIHSSTWGFNCSRPMLHGEEYTGIPPKIFTKNSIWSTLEACFAFSAGKQAWQEKSWSDDCSRRYRAWIQESIKSHTIIRFTRFHSTILSPACKKLGWNMDTHVQSCHANVYNVTKYLLRARPARLNLRRAMTSPELTCSGEKMPKDFLARTHVFGSKAKPPATGDFAQEHTYRNNIHGILHVINSQKNSHV